MSMASLDRPSTSNWASGSLCFVPAVLLFVAAGMLHHPSAIVLLILADALTMTAICQVLGLAL